MAGEASVEPVGTAAQGGGSSTVTVSEIDVVTLAVVVVTLTTELVEDATAVDETNVPDAVDIPLVVVNIQIVLETEVVAVATGLTVKRPILLPAPSVK